MWGRSDPESGRCRGDGGWPTHSRGQVRCPSWPAHRGSCDIPRWGCPSPVEGQSGRHRREHWVALSGGDRSTGAEPGLGANGAVSRAGRRNAPGEGATRAHMLIFHRRQLEAVVAEFIDHYNTHRPHRSLDQASPLSVLPVMSTSSPDVARLRRSDRLGGLIHEYKLAA